MKRLNGFLESYISQLNLTKQRIKELLDYYNIPFVFIGGVARNSYISARTTSDVDILVSLHDKPKMLNLPIGYIRCLSKSTGRRFILHDPKTEVEVIYSGDHAGDMRGIEFPEPEYIDNGNNVMTLKSLVEFKICSYLYANRMKDAGDVQELILEKHLKRNYGTGFRKDLENEYNKLWDMTNEKVYQGY